MADIWSLGCIFINMIGGQTPWDEARLSDGNYVVFLDNPELLRNMLPLSAEANDLAQLILDSKPEDRISIQVLQEEITRIATFFMDEDEIATSNNAVRGIALLAASAKHDWMLREARQSLPCARTVSETIPSSRQLTSTLLALEREALSHPPPRYMDCVVGDSALGYSLMSASASSLDLVGLLDEEDVDDLKFPSEGAEDSFEDVQLRSPLASFTPLAVWPKATPRTPVSILPELTVGAISAALTLVPTTPA